MITKKLDDKIKLTAKTVNVKIGQEVKVILKVYDENKKVLKQKEYKEKVQENKKVVKKFTILSLADELNIDSSKVKYISGWIDADDDAEITREYEKEVWIEVIEEKITALYFSYNQPSKPIVHEVKEGENLFLIAQKYNTTVEELVSINKLANANIIYPKQSILIHNINQEEVNSIKLNNTFIPLGTKVNVIAHGTKGSKAKIKILANNSNFNFLKEEQEISEFDVTFDENGQSITPITLRPKNIEDYKSLINKFMPKLGQDIKEEKLILKGEIKKDNYQSSLEVDDMNTIGLAHYQTYIKSAYIINASTGKIEAKLTAKKQGNDIIFQDKEGQNVASTSEDELASALGNINNGLGGLAVGMEHKKGSFALTNSKGIHIKHYESGWKGNGPVKTYSMAKCASRINNGTFIVSIVIGAYQINSAQEKDVIELKKRGVKTSSYIDGFGQQTEQQIGSTALGFAGGTITSILIGIIALPVSSILVVLGGSILIGGAVGWMFSKVGEEGIKFIQDSKGSTIINNYPLKEEN
ncbi:LysM peptidoglycan-binding domain-containing protein [Malaciobacter canalis]|uniref:LysM peptidoglycan-binding domain-containing protein n=1 Tax=Malaciobacter canalis TaxID=1912871 RepID=UPI003850D4E6